MKRNVKKIKKITNINISFDFRDMMLPVYIFKDLFANVPNNSDGFYYDIVEEDNSIFITKTGGSKSSTVISYDISNLSHDTKLEVALMVYRIFCLKLGTNIDEFLTYHDNRNLEYYEKVQNDIDKNAIRKRIC